MTVWINELLNIWMYGFLPATVALVLFSIEVYSKVKER